MLQYEEYFPVKKRPSLFSVYVSLITLFQNRVLTPEFCDEHYFEEHHIVCECYLPTEWSNEKKRFNNIVVITGAEHFILHYILYLIFDDYSMTCAIHRMANSEQNGSIDLIPHIYEQLRKDWAKRHGAEMKGRIWVYSPKEPDRLCRKIKPEKLSEYLSKGYLVGANPDYVMPEYSQGRKEKLSKSNKEWYAEYYKTHESPHKGHKHSEESKAKMSEKAKGRRSSIKGTKQIRRMTDDGTYELRRILPEEKIPEGWELGGKPQNRKSTKLSEETKRKMSKARRNNVWVHKGDERHFVMPDKVQEWLDKGFVLGSNLHYNSPVKGKELSEETKKRMSASKQDGLWVNNGTENKWIARKNLDRYLLLGFRKGRYNHKYEDSKNKSYKAKTLF